MSNDNSLNPILAVMRRWERETSDVHESLECSLDELYQLMTELVAWTSEIDHREHRLTQREDHSSNIEQRIAEAAERLVAQAEATALANAQSAESDREDAQADQEQEAEAAHNLARCDALQRQSERLAGDLAIARQRIKQMQQTIDTQQQMLNFQERFEANLVQFRETLERQNQMINDLGERAEAGGGEAAEKDAAAIEADPIDEDDAELLDEVQQILAESAAATELPEPAKKKKAKSVKS